MERCFVSWTIGILLKYSRPIIHWTHCTSIPHLLIFIPVRNLIALTWLRSISCSGRNRTTNYWRTKQQMAALMISCRNGSYAAVVVDDSKMLQWPSNHYNNSPIYTLETFLRTKKSLLRPWSFYMMSQREKIRLLWNSEFPICNSAYDTLEQLFWRQILIIMKAYFWHRVTK